MQGADYIWGAGQENLYYWTTIGSHCSANDSAMYWVSSLATTERACLEMPPTYIDGLLLRQETTPDAIRRSSSHDDHGETYPLTFEGERAVISESVRRRACASLFVCWCRQSRWASKRVPSVRRMASSHWCFPCGGLA